jgi:MraZ protein
VFRGRYEHTVDEKGRTSLPRRFREELERAFEDDRLVVTTALEPCLAAYPMSEWRAFEERIAAKSQFDPAVIRLKRAVIASAVECQVDGHGRILLPPALRKHAGIERDVVWAGMTRHIEIWAKDRWDAVESSAREDSEGLSKALADLGL